MPLYLHTLGRGKEGGWNTALYHLMVCYTRLFLYENMPQLRYHNPSVKFNFMTHLDKDSFISFNRGNTTLLISAQLASN